MADTLTIRPLWLRSIYKALVRGADINATCLRWCTVYACCRFIPCRDNYHATHCRGVNIHGHLDSAAVRHSAAAVETGGCSASVSQYISIHQSSLTRTRDASRTVTSRKGNRKFLHSIKWWHCRWLPSPPIIPQLPIFLRFASSFTPLERGKAIVFKLCTHVYRLYQVVAFGWQTAP